MKEQAPLKTEATPVFTAEELAGRQLEKRFRKLFSTQSNRDELMMDAALAIDDLKTGAEPNFDWVPEDLRVEVLSEWNEARQNLERFKEEQAEARREMATEHKEERLSAELQETAERSAKLSELEEKFGEIPEEGTPIPQRQIATQIVRKPQGKGAVRRFFDRLAGNP